MFLRNIELEIADVSRMTGSVAFSGLKTLNLWGYRSVVASPPFQGGDGGSTPASPTKVFKITDLSVSGYEAG